MRLALAALASVAVALGLGPARPVDEVPQLDRVVVIVFENKEAHKIVGNDRAPTFNSLGRKYASLTRYTAVAHPSLPNYIALISGATQGIRSNCTSCSVGARSLADTLENARKTWKVYAEGLPRPGFTGATRGRYAKRHVPFLYFRRVLRRPRRLARVVPLGRFKRDLTRGSLPSFSLVVPDLCHDMHDCSIHTGDTWLKGFVPRLLASRQLENGVVFVVFDEGRSNEGGGGRVAAVALGPRVRPGSRFQKRATHYSLLRAIEDSLSLPHLRRAATASPITDIWR
ncbi:MAG: alkaline phosphatase family protein [Actinomycetota bacterium]|nr:alkaline phosphatase family protein [Actinomycetota bacterium]